MKYIFIMILSLVSLNAFAGIWMPHDKEILSIVRKAEAISKSYSKERMPGRAHFDDINKVGGITKFTSSAEALVMSPDKIGRNQFPF
jgi:hypothetical protein